MVIHHAVRRIKPRVCGPCVGIFAVLLLACGPSGRDSLESEPVFEISEGDWRVEQISVSPSGSRLAVSTSSSTRAPGARILLVDLDAGSVSEVYFSSAAREEFVKNNRPGLIAARWRSNGVSVRFPAARLRMSFLNPSSYQKGSPSFLPAVAVGSRAWLEVLRSADGGWEGRLDDSQEALAQPPPKLDSIDPRLTIRWLGKGKFELIDAERGGRTLSRFRGWTWYHLETATIDPTSQWIAVTVSREAIFSHGARALLIERETGRRYVLEGDLLGPLHFRPNYREVLGISRSPGGRHHKVVRWSF